MRIERRRRRWIIAMDGPAGVGKSTVGRLLAKKLGFLFLNTGEMYRALTWKVLKERIDPKNSRRVESLAKR
ncbi:MAG: (d)CMP kinase, partial [Elusimicrobia bacterium]|nr:(d)CMP kinase [Elusimicrobiota bacterium]